jgi:GNAT superfamily N-acetyltransferase
MRADSALAVPAHVMDDALVDAIERHQRELGERWTRVQGGVVVDRPEMLLTIVGEPVPWVNGVRAARFQPDQVDRAIEEAIGRFEEHGVPGMWWVGPSTRPPDLGAALERHGFRPETLLPWFAAPVDAIADGPIPDELAPAQVDGSERQAQWLQAMTAGFGMSEAGRRTMTRLADAVGFGEEHGWLRFVGHVDGRVAVSSGLMLAGGLAGVYNVATAPDLRRRGYAAGMVRFALRRARELGYEVAALSANPPAAPAYERMGFRVVCHVREYLWDPAPSSRTQEER